MPLTIKLVSEHRDLVGDDCVREYYEDGGTIGRSLQNDWILPDPDRYISGRHATIDYKGGMYYLADTSSNGVYMNGESSPSARATRGACSTAIACAWAISNSKSPSTRAKASSCRSSRALCRTGQYRAVRR